MTLILDRPENATVRQDGQGLSVTRKALISNVIGPLQSRQRAALYYPGLPRYGEGHPAWPELKVVDIILTPLDIKTWDAMIIYREPKAEERAHMESIGSVIDVTWFSTVLTEERVTDAHGNRMLHTYSGWPDIPTLVGGRLTLQRSPGVLTAWKSERAEIQLPAIGVRVLLAEATNPSSRLDFVSKVNSGFWSGYPPKTWLFLGPVSGFLDRGRWLNTYELLHRPDDWRLDSRVEVSGSPPNNATEGNGIAFFDTYETANFGQLGFTL